MLPSLRYFASLSLLLSSCGHALPQASVSRSFRDRFGCPTARMIRVADGYHVEGCGRSAEYVCFSAPDRAPTKEDGLGGAIVAGLVTAASAGQRCVLAATERVSAGATPARDAPVNVARLLDAEGRAVLKTRLLFARGKLRALAAPGAHPEHALLIVHGHARMREAPCTAEIFHDGARVPVVQQTRSDPYEMKLVVPIAALAGAQRAARFAGSVCGVEFDLDASGRATLGLFAARFREERARIEREEPALSPPSCAGCAWR